MKTTPKKRPLSIGVVSARMCPYVPFGTSNAGGMQTYIRYSSNNIAKLGATVSVYAPKHRGPCSVTNETKVKVVHLDIEECAKANLSWVNDFQKKLINYVELHKERLDVLYSHYWTSAVAGKALALKLDVPHLVSFHTVAESMAKHKQLGRDSELRIRLEKRIAQMADLVVAWTKDELDFICENGENGQKGYKNAAIIPPGIDTNHFRPLDKKKMRKKLGILEDTKVVLYVGRLDKMKGIDMLLHTFKILKSRMKAQLHLVTSSNAVSKTTFDLKAMADKLGIQNELFFWHSVDHKNLPSYYAVADVFVMPSYHETFGLAALEAEACGKPVVATRVGGLRSIVEDGVTGYLVPWHCPEPFANSIETIVENSLLKDAMGSASRDYARKFNWESSTHKLLDAMEDLVKLH